MEELFYESRSKHNFNETLNLITDIAIENGWKVIQVLDLQEIMKKNGKDILSVKVMEVCKPEYAYEVLKNDDMRIYSNMLPCRISVFENTDGITYISRMNIKMLSDQLGGIMQNVMNKVFSEVEEVITKVTD